MGQQKSADSEPTLLEHIEAELDDAAALSDVMALRSLTEALFSAAYAASVRKLAVEHRSAGNIAWALEYEKKSEEALTTARKLLTE